MSTDGSNSGEKGGKQEEEGVSSNNSNPRNIEETKGLFAPKFANLLLKQIRSNRKIRALKRGYHASKTKLSRLEIQNSQYAAWIKEDETIISIQCKDMDDRDEQVKAMKHECDSAKRSLKRELEEQKELFAHLEIVKENAIERLTEEINSKEKHFREIVLEREKMRKEVEDLKSISLSKDQTLNEMRDNFARMECEKKSQKMNVNVKEKDVKRGMTTLNNMQVEFEESRNEIDSRERVVLVREKELNEREKKFSQEQASHQEKQLALVIREKQLEEERKKFDEIEKKLSAENEELKRHQYAFQAKCKEHREIVEEVKARLYGHHLPVRQIGFLEEVEGEEAEVVMDDEEEEEEEEEEESEEEEEGNTSPVEKNERKMEDVNEVEKFREAAKQLLRILGMKFFEESENFGDGAKKGK